MKEAEDCAREADAACVTANEARAALRGDLESANKQIDRLREMNRHATARAEAAESRCSTDSAQVELLRAELQEVDQAAARAVQRAKEEAAHSQALQAELARLREQLKMSGNGASGDKDTVALLRAELAESSKQAKRYQNAFEKREQDVEELKALFNSLREEQAEMEVARSAAMVRIPAIAVCWLMHPEFSRENRVAIIRRRFSIAYP